MRACSVPQVAGYVHFLSRLLSPLLSAVVWCSVPLFAGDDDSVEKREREAAIGYLRDLLNKWDPIGGGHVPPDEYDCLVGPLLSKLNAGAGRSQISEFLRGELADHFGLDPDGLDVDGMANRLVVWWAAVE